MSSEYTHEFADLVGQSTLPALGPTASAAGSAPLAAFDPATIPGLEVLGRLGEGGMGVVWKVRQFHLNRLAALKALAVGTASDSTALIRFLLEAEVVAQIQHEHVVRVFEFGQHGGAPYLLLEYVEGPTLAAFIDERKPLAATEAARLVIGIARGLAAAHALGVVHRDVKPSNILLTSSGVPKVSDFGIAKRGQTDVTMTGAVLGTPAYMSPEQAAGRHREIGVASDVYSLGAVLYELLTGQPPFVADSILATLDLVQKADARPIPGIPRDLETICLKCLRKDPATRYPTMNAFAEDLGAFLEGKPITARPVGPLERAVKWTRRHPATAAGLAVGVLAVLGLGLGGLWLERRSDARQRAARAAGLVASLETAMTPNVPDLLRNLEGVRAEATADLHAMARRPLDEKPGLHARIALGGADSTDELYDYLFRCRADELVVLRDALHGKSPNLHPSLRELATSNTEPSSVRLRAAAALAGYLPDDAIWNAMAGDVIDWLVAEDAADTPYWAVAFDPVGSKLEPVLASRYRDEADRVTRAYFNNRREARDATVDVTELSRLALGHDLMGRLLVRYAGERPDSLAELAGLLTDGHVGPLIPKLERHREAVLPLLRTAADTETEPADPAAHKDAARAGAIAALARLGETDRLWNHLKRSPDPTIRSFLIVRLAAVDFDPRRLIRKWYDETDPSIRAAIVLALNDYPLKRIPQEDARTLLEDLPLEYVRQPDSGLHSAIGWYLLQRRTADTVDELDATLASKTGPTPDRNWFVNSEKQTFAVFRGPFQLKVGSPEDEGSREIHRERERSVSIPRSFAVGTHEVTRVDVNRFRKRPRGNPVYLPDDSVAAGGMTFYEAAEYCNWLNAREGIPRDQWCFLPNDAGRYASGLKLAPDYLKRKGYRFPTEIEWECAARAGTTTIRPYGRGTQLLPKYAWSLLSNNDRVWPTGLLRPNAAGLFDTIGNLAEWTMDPFDDTPPAGPDIERTLALVVTDDAARSARGPSFGDPPTWSRTARRQRSDPGFETSNLGFRLCRTLE